MYLLLILLSITTAFACQDDQISIVRRTGMSAGSRGQHSGYASQKVNVPVRFEGKWGCWEQQGGLSFDVKEKKNELKVLVPKSSFKNLPGRTMSYAFVKKDSGTVQIEVATFACLGSQVLAAETFAGTVAQARALQQLDGQVQTTFATGAAAAHLSRQREELAKRFGRSSDLPENLGAYFEENFSGAWSELERYDLMVPTIYLSASMKMPLANLSSSYHTRVLTKSACSPEFEATMAPLRFEKLSVPAGMKAKLKEGNLILSW